MSSKTVPHGADAHSQWIAVATDPDFCHVGGKLIPFHTVAWLANCDSANHEARFVARNHHVYRNDNKIQTAQGNAGKGILSSVYLKGGFVMVAVPPSDSSVAVGGRPMAHNLSDCILNTNVSGVGDAPGKVYTMAAGIAKALEAAHEAAEHIKDALEAAEVAKKIHFGPKDVIGRYKAKRLSTLRGRVSINKNHSLKATKPSKQLGRLAEKLKGPIAILGAGADSAEQWNEDDAEQPGMSTSEHVARAAVAGSVKTVGALAGAEAGAETGAATEAFFSPVGAVVGGFIGGIWGAWLGHTAAAAATDKALKTHLFGGSGGEG